MVIYFTFVCICSYRFRLDWTGPSGSPGAVNVQIDQPCVTKMTPRQQQTATVKPPIQNHQPWPKFKNHGLELERSVQCC